MITLKVNLKNRIWIFVLTISRGFLFIFEYENKFLSSRFFVEKSNILIFMTKSRISEKNLERSLSFKFFFWFFYFWMEMKPNTREKTLVGETIINFQSCAHLFDFPESFDVRNIKVWNYWCFDYVKWSLSRLNPGGDLLKSYRKTWTSSPNFDVRSKILK